MAPALTQIFNSRSSPLEAIDTVWTAQAVTDGVYNATPDGSWDLIHIEKPGGGHLVFLTGQQSQPASVPYQAGEISIVISFAAHFFPQSGPLPPDGAVVQFLPVEGGRFSLACLDLPLPTYDNAELIVSELLSAGVLRKDLVVTGGLGIMTFAASERSLQRHFRDTTGLSQKDFEQIRRAQKAVRLLQAGGKPADVAIAAGFTDQAHMTKSIKRIMGRLPTKVGDINKV
jgi:hypothetical protein